MKQCKKNTLFHSLGIQMPEKNIFNFAEASWKVKIKSNVRRKHCITVWSYKRCKDFYQLFSEASWRVKNKVNVRWKHWITVWAFKCHKRFLSLCWSFMKSREQNQWQKKPWQDNNLLEFMATENVFFMSDVWQEIWFKSLAKSEAKCVWDI